MLCPDWSYTQASFIIILLITSRRLVQIQHVKGVKLCLQKIFENLPNRILLSGFSLLS